jgi:ADP-ribose pyrophosphatase YjhB (NUDIX family)
MGNQYSSAINPVESRWTHNWGNTPNESIVYNGKLKFLSRSVAVLGLIAFRSTKSYCSSDWDYFVPLSTRAANLQEPGKKGLVCGYLDYDETLTDALRREFHEEIGLDLYGKPILGSIDHPYFIQSDPRQDALQNVTMRYRAVFQTPVLPDLRTSLEALDPQWYPLSEAVQMDDLAFNHQTLLQDFQGWIEERST